MFLSAVSEWDLPAGVFHLNCLHGGAAVVIVIMGVVGSGKTTVGRLLAERLHCEFADGDDFHSQQSKDKIHRGIGLTDEDRWPWLDLLRDKIANWNGKGENAVLACSALKEIYRKKLESGGPVTFVYLHGSVELIAARLRARHGHFADEKILASQIADLEEPQDAIAVDVSGTPDQIVFEIRQKLPVA